MYRGASLVIRATGTVYERIEEGAYVKLVVKYGLIRLISTTVDLCEQVENVDMKCPIEKGVLSITKAVEIPKEVPPVSLHAPLSWMEAASLGLVMVGYGGFADS